MKKLSFIAIGVFVIGTISSCKKDWTCSCSTEFAGQTSNTSFTITDTKSKAESQCSASSTTTSVNGLTSNTTCSLVE